MWHHLVPLLMYGGKVLVEKCLPRQAPSQASPCGYSFERHMRYLAEETSIPLLVLEPDRATFEPTFKGRSFITVLVHQGPSICVGILSNIRFPVRGIPPAVCDKIRDFCQPDDDFRLIASDGSGGSYVIADGCGSTAGLTPAMFIQSITEMIQVLARVDVWIVEKGYAR